jgi:glycine cleavage system H lipoate-binding protein
VKMVYGDIWAVTEPNGQVSIGFTQQFIEEKLNECFHVLPAETKKVGNKSPLMVLETNDGLQSIKSPVAGEVVFFSDKARNFPDRLKEDDIVITVFLEGKKKPAKSSTKRAAPARNINAVPIENRVVIRDFDFENWPGLREAIVLANDGNVPPPVQEVEARRPMQWDDGFEDVDDE